MEEELNGSGSLILFPENNIHFAQSNIQAQLEKLEISRGETSVLEALQVCDNVRDHILNYDDEPYLSKNQNNWRRIFIASELFINICSVYADIVDNEYGEIISDMVQWEKYKELSRKISFKMKLELKKEKFFINEAQSKLVETLEGAEEINEMTPTGEESEFFMNPGGETFTNVQKQVQTPEKTITRHDISGVLEPPAEYIDTDDFSLHIPGNITDIREDPKTNTSQLELHTDISRQALAPPNYQNLDAEISIREPTVENKTESDIDEILRILDDIFPKETTEIERPENPIELPNIESIISSEQLINQQAPHGTPTQELENSEEWSLPTLEEEEMTKKKRGNVKIDKITYIPGYATRALQQNRSINIQRVQVFEGPPTILQAISVSHLMRTPGYKSRSLRSSKLNVLYNRHLEVEKKEAEGLILPKRTIEEERAANFSKRKTNGEISEEVGTRTGMHLMHEKSIALVEAPEKTRIEDFEITKGDVFKENLKGVPMSRIINSTIEPPEEAQMERINAVSMLPTPKMQKLQGKSIDPKTSPPWFLSTKEQLPNEKYRKFDYVYGKLQNYWSLMENEGMEKCITLNEFFSFETDATTADFLTVLRIVDKLSIQKKLVLEYKRGDAFIRPFEAPYVSNAQLLLKEKEIIF